MNAPKYAELRSTSKESLIEQYDIHTKNTNVHTGFLLEEIYRRDRAEHDQELMRLNGGIHRLTLWITGLTVFIGICTAIQTWLAFWR